VTSLSLALSLSLSLPPFYSMAPGKQKAFVDLHNRCMVIFEREQTKFYGLAGSPPSQTMEASESENATAKSAGSSTCSTPSSPISPLQGRLFRGLNFNIAPASRNKEELSKLIVEHGGTLHLSTEQPPEETLQLLDLETAMQPPSKLSSRDFYSTDYVLDSIKSGRLLSLHKYHVQTSSAPTTSNRKRKLVVTSPVTTYALPPPSLPPPFPAILVGNFTSN
jgi:hypothetical protein